MVAQNPARKHHFDIPEAAKKPVSIEHLAPAGALDEKLISVKPRQDADFAMVLDARSVSFLH
jgi:hypothetical protein